MNESKTDGVAEVPCTSLLGTTWRHKKKGGIYTVTQTAPKRGDVYLAAQTKGCRSTWKAECLLAWDYELVPNAAAHLRAAKENANE